MNPLHPLLESLRQRWRDRPLSPRELRELELGLDPREPLARALAAYRLVEPRPARPFDWAALRARLAAEQGLGRSSTPLRAPGHAPFARRLAPVGALLLLIGLAPLWLGVLGDLEKTGLFGERSDNGINTSALDTGRLDSTEPFAVTLPMSSAPTGAESAGPDLAGASTAPLEPGVGTEVGAARAALAVARERWAVAGAAGMAPSDYRFTLTRVCYCSAEWRGPFVIRLRDGTTTVARLVEGGDGAGEPVTDPAILAALPLSAEALFRFIEERIGQEGFRALYDERTGLPLSFWSDPIPMAADDELGLEIGDLLVQR